MLAFKQKSKVLQTHKIVLAGSIGVGKRSIRYRIIADEWLDPTYTNRVFQELDPSKRMIEVGNERCIIDLTLVPNPQEIRRPQYFNSSTDGLIVVYDICDRDSFEAAKQLWREAALAKFQDEKNDNGCDVPVLLFGNKTDLGHEREVTEEEGRDFARRIGALWIEGSALDGWERGVIDEAMGELIRRRLVKDGGEKIGAQADDISMPYFLLFFSYSSTAGKIF
ncbi:hypothetical protein G7Y89_g14457 [Cudoniella acicularis]|uniref:small monomeric GTPase n=1 Tax=Cudoniella acicularis TaxID=354080 RepID=A0A8H4R1Y5_9HELO|nr:hypothetical protein G7Y89_g14457 [Cudoniella acicularis]